MKRIKYQLEYPECAKDFITPKSLSSYVEDYSMGTNRTLESYLDMATIDLIYKFTRNPQWCNDGVPHLIFLNINSMLICMLIRRRNNKNM